MRLAQFRRIYAALLTAQIHASVILKHAEDEWRKPEAARDLAEIEDAMAALDEIPLAEEDLNQEPLTITEDERKLLEEIEL